MLCVVLGAFPQNSPKQYVIRSPILVRISKNPHHYLALTKIPTIQNPHLSGELSGKSKNPKSGNSKNPHHYLARSKIPTIQIPTIHGQDFKLRSESVSGAHRTARANATEYFVEDISEAR